MFSKISNSFRSKDFLINEVKNAAIITINRSEKMNSLTTNMLVKLYKLVKDLESCDKKLVIIQGAGDKAFCSGGDLKDYLGGNPKNPILNVYGSNIMYSISHYKKVFTVILDGITMGGACYIAMTAKYRIATERTIFAMPEAKIGLFVNAGSSYFLSRLKYNLGYYIGIAGAYIYGYDVVKCGLASHYVESKNLEAFIKSLAECEDNNAIERTIAKFSTVPKDAKSELDKLLPKIEKCFGADSVEKIYENLYLDGSPWSIKIIKNLNKMSPRSMKLVHKLLHISKDLSLCECLKLEQRITFNITNYAMHDFQEGVRALIIEKDFKPKWEPHSLSDVKMEYIEKLFAPIPYENELKFFTEYEKSNL